MQVGNTYTNKHGEEIKIVGLVQSELMMDDGTIQITTEITLFNMTSLEEREMEIFKEIVAPIVVTKQLLESALNEQKKNN